MDAHDKIFELLLDKDEITWQTLIYELVKTEEMDPWDIDVSILTKRYITTIKKLKELNFRISGKVLLAAAVLLRIKSNRLLTQDLTEFDRLIAGDEESIEELAFEETFGKLQEDNPRLIPRMPQPRKRKVSIYDLVDALQKALEVKRRRVLNSAPPANVRIPKKSRDITQVIREVYGRVKAFILGNKQNTVTFSQIVPSDSKEDKIYTFIPLLHLSNQRKIELHQEKHFGEIDITLNQVQKEIDKELGKV
ncbi:segregation/condensation protein A [Candidatus Woesearchaeota archaeon]|nr:segregation/condensation protein A [Candidatus Woesearchaeota archaeon]